MFSTYLHLALQEHQSFPMLISNFENFLRKLNIYELIGFKSFYQKDKKNFFIVKIRKAFVSIHSSFFMNFGLYKAYLGSAPFLIQHCSMIIQTRCLSKQNIFPSHLFEMQCWFALWCFLNFEMIRPNCKSQPLKLSSIIRNVNWE